MTDSETWEAIFADWKEKHDAFIAFPLVEAAMMQGDRLAEYEALREAEAAARARKDAFLKANT
jgi:hypothetical protein